MMFEVADLSQASPATVSRCGMVYLEPSILGLQPFVECWLKRLPDSVFKYYDTLTQLFENYLEVDFSLLKQKINFFFRLAIDKIYSKKCERNYSNL